MTLNPVKLVQDWLADRREKEAARRAKEGLASSGHLSEGERQRLFRERQK